MKTFSFLLLNFFQKKAHNISIIYLAIFLLSRRPNYIFNYYNKCIIYAYVFVCNLLSFNKQFTINFAYSQLWGR